MKLTKIILLVLILVIACRKNTVINNESLKKAVDNNNIELIKQYIKNGGDLDVNLNDNYDTMLLLSIYNNQQDIFELLLKNGANIDAFDCNLASPLLVSVILKRLAMTKKILENNPSVQPATGGKSPMYFACKRGDIELVKLLIPECGTDSRSLAVSIIKGHTEITKILLNKGADPYEKIEQKSSFDIAQKFKLKDIQKFKLEENAFELVKRLNLQDMNKLLKQYKYSVKFIVEGDIVPITHNIDYEYKANLASIVLSLAIYLDRNEKYPQASKIKPVKTISDFLKLIDCKNNNFFDRNKHRLFYVTPKHNSKCEIINSTGFKIPNEVFEILCYKSDEFLYIAYADGTIKETTFEKLKKKHENKELIKLVIESYEK